VVARDGAGNHGRLVSLDRVVALLCGTDAGDMRHRPRAKTLHRLAQRLAQFRKLVIDSRRDGRRDGWEMPSIARFNSMKRFGPSPSNITIIIDHLSPTRLSTGATDRQIGPCGTSMTVASVTLLSLGDKFLRSCAAFMGGYLACPGNKSIPRTKR